MLRMLIAGGSVRQGSVRRLRWRSRCGIIDSMKEGSDTNERVRAAAQILKQHGAREVYLFGSAADGAAQNHSDIDMAVSGLPPELFFRAMARAGRVLGRVLDLIDLDEPNPFTRHLQSEGKLVRVA